jgi:hypothetical protein
MSEILEYVRWKQRVFLRIWELSKLREPPLIFQEIRISFLGLHFLIVQ